MTDYNFGDLAVTTAPARADKVPVLVVADHSTPPANSSGSNQMTTVAALGLAVTAVVNAVRDYGADPTGGSDSTAAIQAALLSFGTLGGWSQGSGGVVFLPQGLYKISKTLVIPSGVTLQGTGWGSQVSLIPGSNCDMIQAATYNSASQAAVLGVSAGSITNAFWAGVRDLCIHGDSFYTTVPGYCHGINCTTNPLTSAAPADPDFDPMFTVENTRIEGCTGDGYFHNGRSGAFLKRVWSAYNNGVGFTPSFDTTMVDCLSEGNLAGGYFNHGSNTGAACKFYNNNDSTWVSGHAYSVGNVAVSAGLMYFCTAAVSGSTAPASDPAHWTALTGATAPQATGYDWYWDTGAGGHCWAAVESQQPSRGGFYFKGPNAGPISIDGQSENVNFNNGQADYNAANPNHYAAVTLDGVGGVNFRLNSGAQGGGAGIICTSLNSPGVNTLIASTDNTEAAVFNGGTPVFALVNGLLSTDAAGTSGGGHFNGAVTAAGLTVTPNSAIGGGNANLWFDSGSQVFEFFNNGSVFGVYDQTNFVNLLSVSSVTGNMTATGNVGTGTAGNGLTVKEGSNAKQGTAVLAAGSVTVANTSVTANSRIFLTSQAGGGTPGWLRVSARTAGTSFTITSSSGTDTSTVAYEIFEPS